MEGAAPSVKAKAQTEQEGAMTEEKRTWTEEIEIDAKELVDNVKRLIQAGNVRRLIIRTPDDKLLLEIPLTAGVVAGGVVTLVAPVLAALGAMAALLAQVKIQVVREKQ
jgi:hypothetical protein